MAEVVHSPLGCTTETPSPKSFTKWCSKYKVLWEKCKIAVSDTTGRCVVAKQLIKKGEVVVEVPDSQVLMAENSQIAEHLAEDGLVKPAEDALLEVQGLILAVMYEKALGNKSHWEPYLSFLPNNMSHMPIYWTDSELAELRGTAAYDKIIGRVQHPADAPTRMSQLFDELVLPFVQSHDNVCQLLLGVGPDDTTEEEAKEKLWPHYQWATAVVASYSFVLGDDQYQGMVPVWDLLNHITGKVNVKLHHDADQEVLQMIATEDIPAGSEVVNCYGQLSNAELLRGYGYVEQHNTIKHVQIPAQFLIRAAAAAAAADHPTAAIAAGGGRDKQKAAKSPSSSAAVRNGGGVEKSEDLGEDGSPDSEDHDGVPSDHDLNASDQDHDVSSEDHDSDDHDDSDESSDDDEGDEEPDWDLEDDSSGDLIIQQQQQQQVIIPRLAAAQEQIPDWEDRWQLCYDLKLLPNNNIFQIPAGGLTAVQGNLLAVLLLLLADARDCEQLAAAAAAATDQAAATMAAAAAEAKHGKKSKESKKSKQQRQQRDEDPVAAVAAEAVDELHKLKFLQRPSQLQSALLLLVQLMTSRYTCSLQDDQQHLQQLDQLSPRLAAAVVARIGEKEVLQHLIQDLQQQQQSSVADQLMQSARQALTAALQQRVAAAAAAAVAGGHGGCCEPGCSLGHKHDHRHYHHNHKSSSKGSKHDPSEAAGSDEKEEAQQQQQRSAGKGAKRKQQQQQQQQQQHPDVVAASQKKQKKGQKAGVKPQENGKQQSKQKGSSTAADAAGASGGFAFNFQM